MRIIGYLDHPSLKITVFRMDTRLSVKFERNLCELTYKFRLDDHLNSLTEVRALVDEPFVQAVEHQLAQMEATAQQALRRLAPPAGPADFEEII